MHLFMENLYSYNDFLSQFHHCQVTLLISEKLWVNIPMKGMLLTVKHVNSPLFHVLLFLYSLLTNLF